MKTVKTRHFHTPVAEAAEIFSPQNVTVKHFCKLRTDPQHRRVSQTVVLVGADIIEEVTLHPRPESPIKVHTLLHRNGFQPPPGCRADRVATVTSDVIEKIVGLRTSDGVQVVAEVDQPQYVSLTNRPSKSLQRLLVLERLQDPGNLGTLLRTAVALGWDACFLLPGCCDPFNDKALKAGRGAAFKLPMAQGAWPDLKEVVRMHEMQCYGASPDKSEADTDRHTYSEPASITQPPEAASYPLCIILGSEGQGLSKTAAAASRPLAIPMSGAMESLNVSQAGAILMFALGGRTLELYKQVGMNLQQ